MVTTFQELMESKYPIQEGFNFKERNRKTRNLVCGIGINDVEFVKTTTKNGVQSTYKPYDVWRQMLRRVYDVEYNSTLPTYKNASVDQNWLSLSNFLQDLKKLNWNPCLQLDKDLKIKGNKHYSIDTCMCIPATLNSFLTLPNKDFTGKYPLGVHWNSLEKVFKTQVGIDGKQTYIFRSKDPYLCHRKWQEEKLKQAKSFLAEYPEVLRVVSQLQYEIDNNIETISL